VKTLTQALGVSLSVLGLGGYIGTGGSSVTALIPAVFGIPLLILGRLWDRKAAARIAAASLSCIGFLGSVPGLAKAYAWVGGGSVPRPSAVILQSVMAVLCGTYALWFLSRNLTNRLQARESALNSQDSPTPLNSKPLE
jgi:hypothetical protein